MSAESKIGDDEIQIRAAKKEDMAAVAEMIQELANFEEMPEGPKLTVADLQRDCFERSPPAFSCLVAEWRGGGGGGGGGGAAGAEGARGEVVGYAIYFPTYSTWGGRALMLEDLYVRVGMRRRGVGERLFNAVAQEAVSCGACRLDFHVLEWNPARGFYEKKGAVDLTAAEKWCYYRLAGAALADCGK